MEVRKIKVCHAHGLHLRIAGRLVETARKFKSRIYLCRGCKFADSCSILDLLSLEATKDAELAVIAEGLDEKDAVVKIAEFFEAGSGI